LLNSKIGRGRNEKKTLGKITCGYIFYCDGFYITGNYNLQRPQESKIWNGWSFDATDGLSRDQVESTLLQGGQQYYGYEYATLAQTSALLDSYYSGNIKDVDDGWRISTATAAFNFLTDFTETYAQILPAGVTFSRELMMVMM